MGYKQASVSIVIVAILLAAANPLVRGQGLISINNLLGTVFTLVSNLLSGLFGSVGSGTTVTGLSVPGVLTCPPSGPGLPSGPGIPNATIILNCSLKGVVTTVGQTVTGLGGVFNLTALNLPMPLSILGPGLVPCMLSASVNVSSLVCPVLGTAGSTLNAVVMLVQLVLGAAGGLVGILNPGIFVRLAV